ncbi:MAG: copper amine oxidase N-terminal domain-containing protein [Clostridiales bacterium]|nr:copper amine oxidase N-terminal domain-containing protein [Clostridiales bacterium]
MRKIPRFFLPAIAALLLLCVTASAAERTAAQIVHDKGFQNSLLRRIQTEIDRQYGSQYKLENYLLSFDDAWTDGKTRYLNFAVLADLTPKAQSEWNNSPSTSFLYAIAIDSYLSGGELSVAYNAKLYTRSSTSTQVDLSPFTSTGGANVSVKSSGIDKIASFGIAPANPRHYIELLNGQYLLSYDDAFRSDPNVPQFTYDGNYKPLFINGALAQSDVKTVNDRTLVPVRAIVEGLGGHIEWDEKARKVTVDKDGVIIEMTIGSKTVRVNGQSRTIDVAPNIYNDYTYLPVRFVSENLGANVSWNTERDNMLVQQAQGNVFVDQYDSALPARSKEEAANRVKAAMNQNFLFFKAEADNEPYPYFDLPAIYQQIQNNIDNTKVVGEVSRYYVIDSVQRFYCDKYSSEIFYAGSFGGGASWVSLYLYGDFWVFAKGYFAD